MNSITPLKQEQMEIGWWVELLTDTPCCTYYFGAFESAQEAALSQGGYIEDLMTEGAQGITVRIKWCKPRELTILLEDELVESS